MRCLSPHSRYSIQVLEGKEQIMMDGRGHAFTQVLTKPVIANFEQQGLQDNEIEVALETFEFSGLPDGVNPLTRIGVFDTEAYVMQFDDEEQRADMLRKIDQRLQHLQKNHPNEFIIVDMPAAKKPWPTYDDMTIEEVLQTREIAGISPEVIRLYELENQNREEIVEAMLRIEDPEGAVRQFGPVDDDPITVSV